MKPCVTTLVGAQWGDEGKGKWIDILSENAKLVARFQGGNNAGHTLYIDGKKVVLHQIPSGAFRPETKVALTAGVVINPVQLAEELAAIATSRRFTADDLWISKRAHVTTPIEIALDSQNEDNAATKIGTTKRGIGPTYAARSARSGLRIAEFVEPTSRRAWIERQQNENQAITSAITAGDWQRFEEAAEVIRPFVCEAENRVRSAILNEETTLLEGAQGVLLDISHGTYPFVTSSHTIAGGALSGIGFSHRYLDRVYGVAKAYTTRVGEGPFPTEDRGEVGQRLSKIGNEFGATTGRPRRCGWLDIVALRYACQTSGLDALIINKIDVLDEFSEIGLCVAYEHPTRGRITEFPAEANILSECQPVYQMLPGWRTKTVGLSSKTQLPQEARQFIDTIRELTGCPVAMVGTGVGRNDAIFYEPS